MTVLNMNIALDLPRFIALFFISVHSIGFISTVFIYLFPTFTKIFFSPKLSPIHRLYSVSAVFITQVEGPFQRIRSKFPSYVPQSMIFKLQCSAASLPSVPTKLTKFSIDSILHWCSLSMLLISFPILIVLNRRMFIDLLFFYSVCRFLLRVALH
jgi:hypothetical protein